MIKFNKKGMMDDLFDLLFTIFVSLFALLLVGAILTQGVKQSHAKTLSEISEFKHNDAAVNNLRILLYSGISNLETVNLDEKISKSVLLNGKTITSCEDYTAPEECRQNLGQLSLVLDVRCFWNTEQSKCISMPALAAALEEEK